MKKIPATAALVLTLTYISNAQTNALPLQLSPSTAQFKTVSTSVNETTINDALKLYPNPSVGYLVLEAQPNFNLEGANLLITDIKGRIVFQQERIHFNNQAMKISTESLPAGMYTLRLTNSGNAIVVKPFVVEK